MKKKDKKVRDFFNQFVEIFFSFCFEKFSEKPSFQGSAPRDLGSIYDSLRQKVFDAGKEWEEELAKKMFSTFLQYAYEDRWLKENFLLQNLNRQKDKIFFKIKSVQNGKTHIGGVTNVKPEASIQPQGSFGKL